jgi:hypothetical protein
MVEVGMRIRLSFAFALVSMAAAPAASAEGLTVGGYAEAFYQWNFGDPSNGLTHFRGFDNRHDSFTLSNAAVDVAWQSTKMDGRVVLQTGLLPSTVYLAEPLSPGAAASGSSSGELWRFLQQAYVGIRPASSMSVQAGLFVSPIGPESIAVKDSWSWSRSTLFFALPYYHAGARLTVFTGESLTLQLGVCNGWNNVVDNNDSKSVHLQAIYQAGSDLVASVLYFGGVERVDGGAEGEPWRSTIDAHATWQVTADVATQLHLNGGFEDGDLGMATWFGFAASARTRIVERLHLAVRIDALFEDSPDGSFILIPAERLASATVTLDHRPTDGASLRLEFRFDESDADLFFGGDVTGDGVLVPFVPNRSSQSTLTIGLVTWI